MLRRPLLLLLLLGFTAIGLAEDPSPDPPTALDKIELKEGTTVSILDAGSRMGQKFKLSFFVKPADKTLTPEVEDIHSWKIISGSKICTPSFVLADWDTFGNIEKISITLPELYTGNTQLFFLDYLVATVEQSEKIKKYKHFRWLDSQPIGFQVSRGLDDNPVVTLDYHLNGELAGYKSIGFNLKSEGTLTNSTEYYSATKTDIGFTYSDFLLLKTLTKDKVAHYISIEASFGFETGKSEDELVSKILNKRGKFSADIEIPYTNFFVLRPYKKGGLIRQSLPLLVGASYYSDDIESDQENVLPERYEVRINYELPFSKYLIIDWSFHYTEMLGDPFELTAEDGSVTPVTYTRFHQVRVAQDLQTFLDTFGTILPALGFKENYEGKNFIFFEFNTGRRSPDFVDIKEKKIGVSVYF